MRRGNERLTTCNGIPCTILTPCPLKVAGASPASCMARRVKPWRKHDEVCSTRPGNEQVGHTTKAIIEDYATLMFLHPGRHEQEVGLKCMDDLTGPPTVETTKIMMTEAGG